MCVFQEQTRFPLSFSFVIFSKMFVRFLLLFLAVPVQPLTSQTVAQCKKKKKKEGYQSEKVKRKVISRCVKILSPSEIKKTVYLCESCYTPHVQEASSEFTPDEKQYSGLKEERRAIQAHVR